MPALSNTNSLLGFALTPAASHSALRWSACHTHLSFCDVSSRPRPSAASSMHIQSLAGEEVVFRSEQFKSSCTTTTEHTSQH